MKKPSKLSAYSYKKLHFANPRSQDMKNGKQTAAKPTKKRSRIDDMIGFGTSNNSKASAANTTSSDTKLVTAPKCTNACERQHKSHNKTVTELSKGRVGLVDRAGYEVDSGVDIVLESTQDNLFDNILSSRISNISRDEDLNIDGETDNKLNVSTERETVQMVSEYSPNITHGSLGVQINTTRKGDGGLTADNSHKSHYEIDEETTNLKNFSDQTLAYGDARERRILHTRSVIVDVPTSERVPCWFPENIKTIYETDHGGGALTFQELNDITRFRARVEMRRRRNWKKYLEAGQARWKLQQILHKLRVRPTTKEFYTFRKNQYTYWKEEALRRWKGLERIHRSVLFLDEIINTNFLMERVIYKASLDGSLK